MSLKDPASILHSMVASQTASGFLWAPCRPSPCHHFPALPPGQHMTGFSRNRRFLSRRPLPCNISACYRWDHYPSSYSIPHRSKHRSAHALVRSAEGILTVDMQGLFPIMTVAPVVASDLTARDLLARMLPAANRIRPALKWPEPPGSGSSSRPWFIAASLAGASSSARSWVDGLKGFRTLPLATFQVDSTLIGSRICRRRFPMNSPWCGGDTESGPRLLWSCGQ